MASTHDTHGSFPGEDASWLEPIIEAFERVWKAGRCPQINDYLADQNGDRSMVLRELVHTDLEYRCKSGEESLVEGYLEQFPELTRDPRWVVELILIEHELGRRKNPTLSLVACLERFPQYRDELRAACTKRPSETSRRSRLHCPQCRHVLEVAEGATEIQCALCGSTMQMVSLAQASVPLDSGKRLGKFELLEVVGQGAFGVVYRARDRELDRIVAVKIPRHGAWMTSEEIDRFLREGRSTAQLQHPGIVAVHEVGRVEDTCFLVSEFVQGPALAEILTDGRPSARESAHLVATVADALQYAHEHGVIHRDVKPANILLSGAGSAAGGARLNGTGAGGHGEQKESVRFFVGRPLSTLQSALVPKIADFGLALRDTGEVTVTLDGQILGTPAYMSPEQAGGSSHQVDGRSDIYSLGVILYQLLTGELPFRGNTRMLLHQVLHDEPRAPCSLNDRIPRDLETICLKAMAKSPGQRYARAGDLAADLRRFLTGEPILARPVNRGERLWRWCRRNPATALLLGSVAALLCVIAVGSMLDAHRLALESENVRTERDNVKTERNNALDSLREAYLAQAQARRFSGQPGRHFESLEALTKAAALRPGVELRNEALACLPLVDLRPAKSWQAHTPDVQGRAMVVFDAALEHYVEQDARGNLSRRRIDDDAEIERRAGPGEQGQLLGLTPDGRSVVAYYSRKAQIQYLSFDAPAPIWTVSHRFEDLCCADLSPDGRVLAIGLPDAIQFLDMKSGVEIRRLPMRARPVHVRFHPFERKLAVIQGAAPRPVEIVEVDSGKVLRAFSHPAGVTSTAWHPQGTLLAVAHWLGQLWLWDTKTGAQQAILHGHQTVVTACDFNATSEILASKSWDKTTRLWDPTSGKLLVTIPGGYVGFGRDGRRLGFVRDNEVGLWDVAAGRQCRTLYAPGEKGSGPWYVDIHPDGKLAASAGDDGVRLWDLTAGKELLMLPTGFSRTALFHPSGKSLITYGGNSLWLWPLTITGSQVGIGAPRLLARLSASEHYSNAGLSRDGRWLAAVASPTHMIVLDLENPDRQVRLGPHLGLAYMAISQDGQWVLTGTQHGSGIKVWSVRTGAVEKEIPAGGYGGGLFSPDNRWVFTKSAGHAAQFWDLADWQPRSAHHQLMTISADGRLMAARTDEETSIVLLDVVTGEEVAHLIAPNQLTISSIRFSADGGVLAASCYNSHMIQVWDLHDLRHRLGRMNLDW